MYKYCESDDTHISLHDCYVTYISYSNNILTIIFDDGFYLSKNHYNNTTNNAVRTTKSKVDIYISDSDFTDIFIFKKLLNIEIRKRYSLNQFIELINNDFYSLEFLYQYKGYQSVIFECCLHSNKKPYLSECEIKLLISKIEYFYNDIQR